MFRSTRSLHLPTRELPLSPDTTVVLHQVYNLLLGLLGRAKLYVDASVHGTTKLVQYFSFMTYCLISKTEKLMFSGYFMDLWNLFQVRSQSIISCFSFSFTLTHFPSLDDLKLSVVFSVCSPNCPSRRSPPTTTSRRCSPSGTTCVWIVPRTSGWWCRTRW